MNYTQMPKLTGFVFALICLMGLALKGIASDSIVARRLLTEVTNATDDTTRVKKLIELSNTYSTTDLREALKYADQSLVLAEQTGSDKFLSDALFNAGNISFQIGAYEIATQYFFRFIDIQKKENNRKKIAFGLTNLGAVKLQMKQYENAGEYFNRAVGIYNSLNTETNEPGVFPEVISIYNNLGVIAKEKGDYQKAIELYNRGLHLALMSGAKNDELAALYNNLGNAFLLSDRYEDAYGSYLRALNLRKSINDKAGCASSYRNLGDYYIKRGNRISAIRNYDTAFSLASEVGSTPVMLNIAEDLYEVYYEWSKPDSALRYLMLAQKFEKEINADEAAGNILRTELANQFDERQKTMLESQKRREWWYLTIGIILLLTAAIAGLLFILSRSRNQRLKLEKSNADLLSRNLILESKSLQNELELRNKELATNVIYKINQKEIVEDIANKLKAQIPNLKKDSQDVILKVAKDLKRLNEGSVWKEFEVRFQQVHNDFYEKLNIAHGDLTINERRLCAFLKLNMTTKDIAALTGQSIRSIEAARTRLRKKLNINYSDVSLVEYFNKL